MKEIYIRLLDGATAYVPCTAIHISNDNYQIVKIRELDIENDVTAIWEFFPGDLVKCKLNDDKVLFAESLISLSTSFKNRKVHQLIFRVVNSLGEISDSEISSFNDEIDYLINEEEVVQKNHPIVKKWLNKISKTRK